MKQNKYDNIRKIVDRMNGNEKNGKIGLILLLLRSNEIISFIDTFLDTKYDKMSDNMLDLVNDIIVHSKTVYENDVYCDPYSDNLYDKMLSKFKKFRDEPFGNNSIGLANAKYKYDELSGTLDKKHFVYNVERTDSDDRGSIEEYIKGVPISKHDEFSVLVNQKKDGASATIDYKYDGSNYVAVSAISRGKKDYGEGTDVSAIMPDIKFSSKKIKKLLGYCPEYIGVQYEFLISDENKKLLETYLNQTFVNNRSAAAGLLRRIVFANKKDREILKKFMSLVPVGFDVLDEYQKSSYRKASWNELYMVICDTFIYGDIDMSYEIIHGTKSEILEKFNNIAADQLKKRKKLNHAIDGLVMTILDKDIQRKLGRKNNINQYQIAYKFPEEGQKTVIRDVIITTGNFGYKEILLKVDPVILNGTTQFKAQIHSLNKFKKMKLRIGDEIILKLSGDVIPFAYKDSSCHEGDGKKIKLPKYCECGAPLQEEKNKLRCPNKCCPFRIVGSLSTFFVELNAKGIGEKTCKLLHDELGVEKPSDILRLTTKDFKSLSGFKDASAKLCMDTIDDIIKKPRTISTILSALGIDSFRTSTANKLLETIDINDLIKSIESGDKDKLISIIRKADGIDKNAIVIAEGLIDKLDELKELLSIMTIRKTDNVKYDKTLVISGIRNDDKLTEIANNSGYNVKDSGKKFDLLVIKDSSMMDKSKAKYALQKGIPIMTRNEFMTKYDSSV